MEPDFQKEIRESFKRQDLAIEHLTWQVTGHESLGIEGLKPSMKRMEGDVKKIQTELGNINAWKNGMWKIDLKKLVTAKAMLRTVKSIAWMVGMGGGSFGALKLFEFIFEVIEK